MHVCTWAHRFKKNQIKTTGLKCSPEAQSLTRCCDKLLPCDSIPYLLSMANLMWCSYPNGFYSLIIITTACVHDVCVDPHTTVKIWWSEDSSVELVLSRTSTKVRRTRGQRPPSTTSPPLLSLSVLVSWKLTSQSTPYHQPVHLAVAGDPMMALPSSTCGSCLSFPGQ